MVEFCVLVQKIMRNRLFVNRVEILYLLHRFVVDLANHTNTS